MTNIMDVRLVLRVLEEGNFETVQVDLVPGTPTVGGLHLFINLFNGSVNDVVDLRKCRHTVSGVIADLARFVTDCSNVDSICISLLQQRLPEPSERIYRLAFKTSMLSSLAEHLVAMTAELPGVASGDVIESSAYV